MTKPSAPVTVHRSASRSRQTAKRIGLDIPNPQPSLPDTELEQTDTM